MNGRALKAAPASVRRPTAKPRVLIADDEPVVRAALSAQLKTKFCVVGEAEDADGAIALARRHRPDAVLLDVEMPGGGLHATQTIHDLSPETVIVILSSDTARSSVLRFLDAGAVAYLRKGTSAQQISVRLTEALEAGKLARQPVDHVRRASDDRFRAAFDEAGSGMAIMPLEGEDAGRLVSVNSAYARMLGREAGEMVGGNAERWTHPEDLPEGLDDRLAELAAGDVQRTEFEARYLHHDGQIVWADVTAASFCDENGVRSAIVQVLDVSERKNVEDQLQHLADHDALSDLYNRRRFDAELERELARAKRYDGRGALLALDLDGFKFVNDSLGHAAGDELVTRVGRALLAALRETDILARTGGDEFAVLLPEADEAGAMLVAQKLLEEIRNHGTIVRRSAHAQVTTSIGITTFQGSEPTTGEDLLVEADIAMYDAKGAGKDRVSIYRRDEQHRAQINERQDWLRRLRHAVNHDELVLFAQPITPIGPLRAPQFELLLRMGGADGELILPGTFLYNAERFGLMQSIDRWVLAQAVDLLHQYKARDIDIVLSVNVSPKTLNSIDIAQQLRELVADNPINDGSLIIEITETAAIAQIERAHELAHNLRALGCRIAIDDFGAGFATFYYLKHLNFDYIKIDGEFIKELPRNTIDQAVVRSVVDIARQLGAETIAEFVQDDETLAVLRQVGVDYAQGYHTGRPEALDIALPPLGVDSPT
jgi:diguanylate cyclase (GGDEF)-like protein/PAS domain S-box-containing protein